MSAVRQVYCTLDIPVRLAFVESATGRNAHPTFEQKLTNDDLRRPLPRRFHVH